MIMRRVQLCFVLLTCFLPEFVSAKLALLDQVERSVYLSMISKCCYHRWCVSLKV